MPVEKSAHTVAGGESGHAVATFPQVGVALNDTVGEAGNGHSCICRHAPYIRLDFVKS